MSYLKALYDTYEQNLQEVGEVRTKETRDQKEIEYMLLPISHTTQTAHIEVTVLLDGTFHMAKVLHKINTILPFTEESGSRAGQNYVPHMLHDKLMFVAGDYKKFVETDDKKAAAYDTYIKQLESWCESSHSHSHIEAIYNYVKKGTLIEDLICERILYVGDNGLLLSKWTGELKEKPEIFTVLVGDQESAFVRFNVHEPGEITPRVWRNPEIFKSFISYYNTQLKENDICYVLGREAPKIERHPNKLRNSGDKAKLISANDSGGFTFRGRFTDSLEVANISYEVSQKAHNALKWLIDRQARTIDGRVFLVWGAKNLDMPTVTEDLSEIAINWDDLNFDLNNLEQATDELKEVVARQYKSLLAGLTRTVQLEEMNDEKVYILTIDAATPGRLAVLYFREFNAQSYFERLANWHQSTSWRQMRKIDGQWKTYYGSPSFYSIAHAAFGPRPSDKVVKGVMERLLPCVLDGRKIPLDIVRNAIVRASNPQFFETWEWEQVLTIACALVAKHYEEEGFKVALDIECKDRDYLFGRLLAVADVLERSALGKEENRATNALRYMNAFQNNPERTWGTIQKNLQPYQMKLREKGVFYSKLIDRIASEIPIEQFNNKSLSGKYLLGYYSQRQDLYTKKETSRGEDE